jgi:hypothetical protein
MGSAQVVIAAPHAIRSPRLQPHLTGNVERLVGVVWSLRILSSCWDLRTVKELHRQFFLYECGLLDPFDDFPSATNNVRSTQVGAAAARRHQHGLKMKGFSRISLSFSFFLGCFVFLLFLLMSESYSQNKK